MSRLDPRAKLLALLALSVYRTTRIGQMKAALRAVHLPRVFVDALAVAFRVVSTVV